MGESPSISIIIPWQDRGDPVRRRIFEYVAHYYSAMEVGEVIVGSYAVDDQPLNRSRLRNNGAAMASGDILMLVDADSLVSKEQVLKACELAAEAPGAVLPLDRWPSFAEPEQTMRVLDGEIADPMTLATNDNSYLVDGKVPDDWHVGPAYAIRKEDYQRIGGFDEDFVGWGEEEREFLVRTSLLLGPLRTVPGPCVHLNHEDRDSRPEFQQGTPERAQFIANRQRAEAKRREILRAQKGVTRREGEPVIAVYSIAKNEEAHVERWAASAKDADQIILVDTGSTDGTVKVAKDLGLTVHEVCIDPWRFDDGRNASLALVPKDVDICIPLDLDEVLVEGWREILANAWRSGGRRFTFEYVFSWNADGTPNVHFSHDKIHARHGFRWMHPAHETLSGEGPTFRTALKVHHYPDNSKPRTQYLDLLERGYREMPKDARRVYYYARELAFQGKWEDGRKHMQEYLELPNNYHFQERSEAMLYMARMLFPQFREPWLLKACAEAPERRECWYALMRHYIDENRNTEARGAAARALSIKTRNERNSFHCTSEAWSDDHIKEIAKL